MSLDVMMPGLDGFQVMKQMKANPETETIPVILLTAMLADGTYAGHLGLSLDLGLG